MKENVAKKRPIFRGANAPFYNVPHIYIYIYIYNSHYYNLKFNDGIIENGGLFFKRWIFPFSLIQRKLEVSCG